MTTLDETCPSRGPQHQRPNQPRCPRNQTNCDANRGGIPRASHPLSPFSTSRTVFQKKKKKRGRRKRTGTLFAYEARSLWRIIVAQAGTYRHDDKEDRFPSAARKNYTRGNTSLVRITGRFPQTSEPDCEPVYFRLRKSRGRKMLSFFFLASSSSFFSFLYLFS